MLFCRHTLQAARCRSAPRSVLFAMPLQCDPLPVLNADTVGVTLHSAMKQETWRSAVPSQRTWTATQLWPQLLARPASMPSAWYSRSDWDHSPGTTMQGVTFPSSAPMGFCSLGGACL